MVGYLTALLVAIAALGSYLGFVEGKARGREQAMNEYLEREVEVLAVRQEMLQAASEAIAKIQIKHTTQVRNFKEVIKHEKVYVDCKHSADAYRLLNNALSGE